MSKDVKKRKEGMREGKLEKEVMPEENEGAKEEKKERKSGGRKQEGL